MNTITTQSIQGINEYLDYLETIPVQAGEKIHKDSLNFVSEIDQSLPEYGSLLNRIISLRYRLNLEERGDINPTLYNQLKPLFPEGIAIQEKIEEVSRYALFAERLIADVSLLNEFINWAVVYGNQIRPLIEFPGTVRKITACAIGARIGFYGGSALQILDGKKKELTLPFEGTPINILNEEAVIKFKNNYCLTIKEIYRIFSDRIYEMGNLEFLPMGICNWNPKKLGSFNPTSGEYDIDYLDMEEWWKELPWIEKITVPEAIKRYQVEAEGENWVFTLKASREKPTMDVVGTHSYLEVAIPDGEGYNIYYFGKFSTERFPITTLQCINCITAVLPAAVCYPDENIFNLNREHGSHSALATHDEGLSLMRSIRKDISNAKDNNLCFQLLNENCCRWVWKKLRHHLGPARIPDVFSMTFLDMEPEGVIGSLFRKLRKLSVKKQTAILSFLFFICGGWRRRKVIKKNGAIRKISVFSNATWKPEASFLHPPKLFYK